MRLGQEARCAMSNTKVFYCWQADSPTKTNRFLIRDALCSAIEQLNEDSPIELQLDEAAEEVQGLVDIPEHIRRKLESCSIFVVDLTIVGKVTMPGSDKVQPNSNVLFEAGYVLAMMRRRNLDPPPVIVVMNTAYGGPKQLPFDLGWRPVIIYNLGREATGSERSEQGARLAGSLKQALRSVIAGGQLFAGLSTPAWKLGSFFDGVPYKQVGSGYYRADELVAETGLSHEEVQQGASELLARGLLKELDVSGAPSGWPVTPTEQLFLIFDPFLQEWNPSEDARQILEDFGTAEGTQISAARLHEHYGWDLRRLEPALAQLINDLLAEDMGERRPPYRHPVLRLSRNADLYLRGIFDPEELRRRA